MEELTTKVKKWLLLEGYPLEFSVGDVFRKAGFGVLQGFYVHASDSEPVREVDVFASILSPIELGRPSVRVAYIVECKWSQDKPWVIFTAPENVVSPPLCIENTITSFRGRAVLHHAAICDPLQKLHTFSSPERTGFGGRVAFTKGQDQFYSALQSVVAKATALARFWDHPERAGNSDKAPIDVLFPIVVLDGQLFEAFFDDSQKDIDIVPVGSARLQWRGAEDRDTMVAVDIVTIGDLAGFGGIRAAEARTIVDTLVPIAGDVQRLLDNRPVYIS